MCLHIPCSGAVIDQAEVTMYISTSAFETYDESLDSLWNNSISLYDNVLNLTNRFLLFPNHDAQSRVYATYVCSNPKWLRTLPILFISGPSGSGKSAAGRLAAFVRDASILGRECSTVALRNECNKQYWLDQESGMLRDGSLIIFDNAWERTFLTDDNLLSMLLRSYERSNAIASVSNGTTGENVSYHTFTGKIITTVSRFNSPSLTELERRCILLYCAKADSSVALELDDLDSYAGDSLYQKYFEYWQRKDFIQLLVDKLKFTRSKQGKKIIPSAVLELLGIERIKLLSDLIASHSALSECSISESWELFSSLIHWSEEYAPANPGKELIRGFLENFHQVALMTGRDTILPAKQLTTFINHAVKDGSLPSEMRKHEALNELMLTLGYRLHPKGWEKL